MNVVLLTEVSDMNMGSIIERKKLARSTSFTFSDDDDNKLLHATSYLGRLKD